MKMKFQAFTIVSSTLIFAVASSAQITSTPVISGSGAPSSSCFNQIYIDNGSASVYRCGAGTGWGAIGSGSGGLFSSFQVGANTAITTNGNYFQLAAGSNVTLNYTGSGTSVSPYIATINASLSAGSSWSSLSAATAVLTLANTTYGTTFTQTIPAVWTWQEVTAATSTAAQSSPIQTLEGNAWLNLAAPVTPTVTATTGTGTVAAATYLTEIAYVNSAGTSVSSTQQSTVLSATGELTVTSPAAEGNGNVAATGYNVYMVETSGTLTLQNASAVAIGTNYVQSTQPTTTGAAAPTADTSAESSQDEYAVQDVIANGLNPVSTLTFNHALGTTGGTALQFTGSYLNNEVLAGPASGGAGNATLRGMVCGDVPSGLTWLCGKAATTQQATANAILTLAGSPTTGMILGYDASGSWDNVPGNTTTTQPWSWIEGNGVNNGLPEALPPVEISIPSTIASGYPDQLVTGTTTAVLAAAGASSGVIGIAEFSTGSAVWVATNGPARCLMNNAATAGDYFGATPSGTATNPSYCYDYGTTKPTAVETRGIVLTSAAAAAAADVWLWPENASNGGSSPTEPADIQISTSTTAIAANTCTAYTATAMTGVTTSMAFSITPTSATGAVTGWGEVGGLVIADYPTANTINWAVCNQTAASITPGAAVTWNVSAR